MGLYEKLFGGGVRSITPRQAYEMMQFDQPPILLDVRQPIETKSGTAPGATLVPLTELGKGLAGLEKGRTVLTICRSGHRSPIAARQLNSAGFEVINVSGGMLGWEKAGLPIAGPNTETPSE